MLIHRHKVGGCGDRATIRGTGVAAVSVFGTDRTIITIMTITRSHQTRREGRIMYIASWARRLWRRFSGAQSDGEHQPRNKTRVQKR